MPGARTILITAGTDGPVGWAAELPLSQALPVGLRTADVVLRYYRWSLAELGLPRGVVELQSSDNGCALLPEAGRFRLAGDRFVPDERTVSPIYSSDSSRWPVVQQGDPLLAATCARFSCLPRLTQVGCQVEIRTSVADCPDEETITGRLDSLGQLHLNPPKNYQFCSEFGADAYSLGGIRCRVGVYGDCVAEAFHAAPPALTASVTVTEPLFPVRELDVIGFRPPIFTTINDVAWSHDYVYATAQSTADNSDCCAPDTMGSCQPVDHALVRLDPSTMRVEKFPGPCFTQLLADPHGDGVLAGQVLARTVVRLSPDGRVLASSPPLWGDWARTKQNAFSAFALSRDEGTLFVAIVSLDISVRHTPVAQILGLDTTSLTVTASSSVFEETHFIGLDQMPDGRLIALDEKLDGFVRLEVHGAPLAREITIQHQAYVGMDLHFTAGHLLPSTEPGQAPWYVGLETALNRLVLARSDVVAVPGRVDTLNLAPYQTRGAPQSAVMLPSGELLVSLVPPLLQAGVSAPGEASMVRLSLGAQPRILPGILPFSPVGRRVTQVGRMIAAPDGAVFGLLPTTGQIFRLRLR